MAFTSATLERLQVVGTLAAGLAHELGTPLNVVRGFAEILAARSLSEEKSRDMLRAIHGQTDRMILIVRQLLDFTRRGAMTKTTADLNQVARGSVQLLEPMARKYGCTVRFVPTDEPLRAQLAESEIQQALCNLLVNAFQSMATGGEVTIHTDVTDGDGAERLGRVRVVDRGVGISAEDLPRIFDPFFTTKSVGEGAGLGLSVSYGIVRDHGGRILVDSTPGRGTCVTVLLPLAGV